jgi:opacity protein-like surface antigen
MLAEPLRYRYYSILFRYVATGIHIMTKKICSIALLPGLTVGAAGHAIAQSKNFEGMGVSLGAVNQEVNVKSSGGTSSAWKTAGNLELTNFKSLNDNWLLGFGVGLDVGKIGSVGSSGGISTGYDDGDGSSCSPIGGTCYEYVSGSSRSSFKDNFSLSLIPAYAFNKNNLGFVRASLNSIKTNKASDGVGRWTDVDSCAESEDPNSDACLAESNGSGNSGSKRLNGWGLGIGYRYQSDSNWFLQAEWKYARFRRDSYLDIKPTLSGATLSVGYRY